MVIVMMRRLEVNFILMKIDVRIKLQPCKIVKHYKVSYRFIVVIGPLN